MKIFYHNDNDGKAAAALVNLYAKSVLKQELNKEDFIAVNYNDSVPNADIVSKNEIVYIVDYSFTKSTIDQLRGIRNKTNQIVWLDHHKSSLEVLQLVRNEYLTLYTEVDINRCGAMITYDHLIKYLDIDNNDNIKEIIKLVDDYDRWVHNYKESLLFNIGSEMFDTNPMSDFWFSANVDIVVASGKTMKEFKDNLNREYCDRFAYTCTINNHECIVLNTPEASSQAFVEYYDKYKFAIRYVFDGNKYIYSIYSSLPDIDCSVIASSINPAGGGHKGAAGFTSDKIEFKPSGLYEFKRYTIKHKQD